MTEACDNEAMFSGRRPKSDLNCLHSGHWDTSDEYVESLLTFVTSNALFQQLCGGVHVLDFLTKEPCLYTTLLPETWREWFELHDISDVLDLLMREDEILLEQLVCGPVSQKSDMIEWRGASLPPQDLLQYVLSIRRYALERNIRDHQDPGRQVFNFSKLPRHVAVGMKPKKAHEVERFISYIDNFSKHVETSTCHSISHIVDFGSGQNYLGRALASPPLYKTVVALESKQLNIDGAKMMDVAAKLADKEKVMRNKKLYRSGLSERLGMADSSDISQSNPHLRMRNESEEASVGMRSATAQNGSIAYVETMIQDGDLSNVVESICQTSDVTSPQLMVVSLHSCGNLLHHGLRSLILNPVVKAVAMVGCCYNLVTERLGPSTYKLPSLRTANHRLHATSTAYDPHGFPMSHKFVTFNHAAGPGVRFNITARMMAVQAPYNWTSAESESFFTRHFYRALLQKIFLDHGIVQAPAESVHETRAKSPKGWTGEGPPITIGSLRKGCYASFTSYVRGSFAKLADDADIGPRIQNLMTTLTDSDIDAYEEKYATRKKDLSIVWSLMAYSATVVESAMVVDRWLYLREQPEVKECWVDCIFDYKQSPRNFVIVGVKH